MTSDITQTNATITIRRMDLREEDRAALERLSELDSGTPRLTGPVLGVEVDGSLLAAISIASGAVIADPFSRTSELRALLELRAGQLEQRSSGRAGRRSRIFGGHRDQRPAVGGSPAGQIIALPRAS